jgi:hypothetical protein
MTPNYSLDRLDINGQRLNMRKIRLAEHISLDGVYPLLLGRGKRCFPEGAGPREFTLVGSMATPTGVLLNTYRHVVR